MSVRKQSRDIIEIKKQENKEFYLLFKKIYIQYYLKINEYKIEFA